VNVATWLYLSSAVTWLYRHGGRCPHITEFGQTRAEPHVTHVSQCERWRFHKRGEHR
jgi:hypothetical protein